MSASSGSEKEDPTGQIVGKSRFMVLRYIAGGSFGRIYLGKHVDTMKEVCIKMEKQSCSQKQVHLEYGFYKLLGTGRGVPKIHYFGPCGVWNALVMDMLGPTLLKMLEKCNGTFSLKTVVQLTIQMISLMDTIHTRGLVYRDTKPENFLLGLPGTPKWFVVHVIDLGLCKCWRNDDGTHMAYQEGKPLTGTARYMSVNNHLGREQSRRDDLEAVGYMLIFLFKGQLPWQGVQGDSAVEKYFKVGEMKMNTSIAELCVNMPDEYCGYMFTVKNLAFDETPDYRKLAGMFSKLLKKLGLVGMNDKDYDWDRNHEIKSKKYLTDVVSSRVV